MSQEPSFRTETNALREFAELQLSPVFSGSGIPRGGGQPVVVIPGLFGNDLYLSPLRSWLGRIGYRPLASGLIWNAGCPDRLTREVEQLLSKRLASGQRLIIIGHSRGGILGWALGSRLGERCAGLALLGSPAGGVHQALRKGALQPSAMGRQAVVDASLRARKALDPDCGFPGCGCRFPGDLARPLSPKTGVFSIASRDDPIVPPGACCVPGADNVLTSGSHSGLVANVKVYTELARALARFSM